MPSESEERKNGPLTGDVCRIKRANNARNQSTRLRHKQPRNVQQFPRRQKRRAEKTAIKFTRHRYNESAECACVPYQRVETQIQLHYLNNTFLFSPFRNIGSNNQRNHHSGANLKRRTLTNRKANFLTAIQVRRTRHRLPRKTS